jgi:hypothetical protein
VVLIRVIALLMLSACIKATPPVQVKVTADVATTITLATVDEARSDAVPKALTEALHSGLAAHNLRPSAVSAPADFDTRRTTAHRLTWLTANAGTAPHVLLVETTAIRYGEISGRYRWAVDVTLSMAPIGDAEAATTARFSVPVHLQHAHQGATEALEAASLGIARRTRRLVNDYLGGAR